MKEEPSSAQARACMYVGVVLPQGGPSSFLAGPKLPATESSQRNHVQYSHPNDREHKDPRACESVPVNVSATRTQLHLLVCKLHV